MKKKTILHIIRYISVLNNSMLETESVIADKLKYAVKYDSLSNSVGITVLKSLSALGVTTNVIQALLDVLENTSENNLNIAIEHLDVFINGFLLKFKDNISNDNNEIYLLVSYTQEIKDLLKTELDNLKGV